MMNTHSDVIVIGGGIMGTSSAFFLRRRGRSVNLIERALVGQYASGTNFGNVRRQGRFLPQIALANRSRALWGRLPELIGDDLEFMPSGHIRVCYDADKIERLERYAAEAKTLGLDLELITRDQIRARFPYFSDKVIAGSYAPLDGHANPRLAAPAFARAAARLGAGIHENTEALHIEKDGDDFVVSCAGGQQFRAPALLVTAGAWGNTLSSQFDEPVPIVTRGPHMAVTEPVPYAMKEVVGVFTDIEAEVLYFRQIKRGNIILGGSTRGPSSIETRRASTLPQSTLNHLRLFPKLVPAFRSLSIIRAWSGVEGYLPDDRPIMGPSHKVSGLFYAFGFCGHGFQLGPGVGDVMAELIDTGASSTPIEPFHIRRFFEASE